MGFRTIAQIPFLNVSEANVIEMHEQNQNIISFGNGFSIAKSRKEKKLEVPIWEKATLSLEEAAAYSGIGIHKLRQIADTKNCPFILWNGHKRLIKRKKLDEYIENAYSI